MARIVETLQAYGRVGLDTSIFIYQLEASSRYAPPVATVFRALADGAFTGVTSVLTLMELTVRPLQLGRPDIALTYETILFNFPNLVVSDVNRSIASKAAELRAAHRLGPADALQIAACLRMGAKAFLTNDKDLRRVSDLTILVLEDFVESW